MRKNSILRCSNCKALFPEPDWFNLDSLCPECRNRCNYVAFQRDLFALHFFVSDRVFTMDLDVTLRVALDGRWFGGV